MAADVRDPNTLLPLGGVRSTRMGDLPERLLARYYVEDHGREWRLFADATIKRPAIEDRGRRLLSRGSDPNAIRDMLAIADHRGWRRLEARGAAGFRREAWLEGSARGLEVRGYRPTERDLQALARRRARAGREAAAPEPWRGGPGARERLRAAEAVIRARVPDPAVQDRILAAARQRLADWLERGATFERLRTGDRRHAPPERRR